MHRHAHTHSHTHTHTHTHTFMRTLIVWSSLYGKWKEKFSSNTGCVEPRCERVTWRCTFPGIRHTCSEMVPVIQHVLEVPWRYTS